MFSRHAPYDVHSRFSDIDSDHRGGILWIAALLSMVYSVLSCIVRVYLVHQNPSRDTVALTVATVRSPSPTICFHPLSGY